MSDTAPKKPVGFMLDPSVLDYKEEHQILREDVRLNGINFIFPAGFNTLDLMEECRALSDIDNFDLMFDITMQLLVGKSVVIQLKSEKTGEWYNVLQFQVTDQYQNLRGYNFINDYPVVILWLTERIGAYLSKKYPTPGNEEPQEKASSKK